MIKKIIVVIKKIMAKKIIREGYKLVQHITILKTRKNMIDNRFSVFNILHKYGK